MNDCPNAAVRDLLPDLVQGHLDPSRAAMVESHLEGCPDCRAEVALLRELRGSFSRTPALDFAAIAAAVPPYRAPVRRSWAGWRTAAAITILVAGGSSVALLQRNEPRRDEPRTPVSISAPVAQSAAHPRANAATGAAPQVPVQSVAGAQAQASAIPSTVRVPATPKAERELAMGGGTLTELSDRELASLLKEIEKLDAVPSIDVESGAISRVVSPRSTP